MRVTALASHDGHRRATSNDRSGATVITKVITKNSGATMLAADCSPAQITTTPATINTRRTAGRDADPPPASDPVQPVPRRSCRP